MGLLLALLNIYICMCVCIYIYRNILFAQTFVKCFRKEISHQIITLLAIIIKYFNNGIFQFHFRSGNDNNWNLGKDTYTHTHTRTHPVSSISFSLITQHSLEFQETKKIEG